MTRDYTELIIWKKAHNLVLNLDKLVDTFPSKERYRLIDQIRRSSASIPTNIVEGCGQNTTPAARRYLFYSYHSIKELDYHLLLARDLGYIPKETHLVLKEEIECLAKMTYSFIKKMPDV